MVLVAQLCLTLCNPTGCSPLGCSAHGIFQARILEWVAISFSRGPSWPRDQTHISCISCIGRWILYQLSHRGSPCSHMALSKCMEVGNTIPRWAAMFSFKFIIVEKGQWIWWTVSSLPQSVPLTNQACVHTSSHMQYTSLQQKHQNSSDWIHCCLFIEQITDWMSAVPLCSLLHYGWSTS